MSDLVRRGTVKVSGGPITDKLKVEVFDGAEWLPLRCVTKIQFSAEADSLPRLILHIETAFLDLLTERELVALELVGAME
jgi:hypothetical protein